jgi:hypothetical protein
VRKIFRKLAPVFWPAARGKWFTPTWAMRTPRARSLMSSSAERKAPSASRRSPSKTSRRKSFMAQSMSRTRRPKATDTMALYVLAMKMRWNGCDERFR